MVEKRASGGRLIQLRPATQGDTSAVRELVQSAYAPYVSRIGRPPGPMTDDYAARVALGRVTVAVDEGEVVGLIVLIEESDHLLVENVAVSTERQRQGIGRTLLAFAETVARQAGLSTLRLYTNAAMTENLAFYPGLGYAEVDRRTDDGFERVFFVKHLASEATAEPSESRSTNDRGQPEDQ